jgi:hypothetical protein
MMLYCNGANVWARVPEEYAETDYRLAVGATKLYREKSSIKKKNERCDIRKVRRLHSEYDKCVQNFCFMYLKGEDDLQVLGIDVQISIISGTAAAICTAVIVARCNGRW